MDLLPILWENLKSIVKLGGYPQAEKFCALPVPRDHNELIARNLAAIEMMQ
jgi:hypothetical protein